MKNKKNRIILAIFLGSLIYSVFIPSTLVSPSISVNNDETNPHASVTATATQVWVKDFQNEISALSISANGSIIALANSTILEVYNKSSNNLLWSFDAGKWIDYDLDMSDSGRYIVIGANNRTYLFDSWGTTPEQPIWYHESNGSVADVAISPDGSRIAVGTFGVNKSIFLFDNVNNVSRWQFYHGQEIGQGRIALSEDGSLIAVGFVSNNASLLLFNDSASANKLPIWQYNGTGTTGHQVTISADGQYICWGSSGAADVWGALYLFNSSLTYPKMPEWIYNTTYQMQSTVMSRDGNFIASDHNRDWNIFKNTLHFFSRKSNVPLWEYNSSAPDRNFDHLAISENGQYLAAGTWMPPSLYIFDNTSSANKNYVYHGLGVISSLDMTLDAKYMAVARTGTTKNLTLYSITYSDDEHVYPEDNSDDPPEEIPDLRLIFISVGIVGAVVLGIGIYAMTHTDKMKNFSKTMRPER